MQELYHHGILGQKWGVRRFQNPDGSLTEAGLKRYSSKKDKLREKAYAPSYKGIDKNGFGRETARSRKAALEYNKILYVPRAKVAEQIAKDEAKKRNKERDDAAKYMIRKYGESDRTYSILEQIDVGSIEGIKFKSKAEKKDWEEYSNKVKQTREAWRNVMYTQEYIDTLLGAYPFPIYTYVGKGEEYVHSLLKDPQYSQRFKGIGVYD